MKRAIISLLAFSFLCAAPANALMPLQYLALHWQDGNMMSSSSVSAGQTIINTMAANGYNTFIQEDWRWEWYWTDPYNRAQWLANAQTIRNLCAAKKMIYLPCVAAMGNDASVLTFINRNLAEGFLSKNVPMYVHNGQIVPVLNDATNGDLASLPFVSTFDAVNGNGIPTGWTWIDMPGTMTSLDTPGRDGAGKCLKMCNVSAQNGMCRVMKTMTGLQPYRPYHIRMWIKTSNFNTPNSFCCKVGATDGTSLQMADVVDANWTSLASTQGWTQYDFIFNTCEYTQVTLYIGCWGGSGTTSNILWLDDVSIEPLGFSNPVRRPGMMPSVTSVDGKTLYIEGKDYSTIGYPDNQSSPNPANIWSQPQIVTALPGGRLTENSQVRVTYHHTQSVLFWGEICPCLANPALYDEIATAMHQIHTDFNPSGYFFNHDEMREGGRDESCLRTGKTPGELLADNIRRCQNMARKEIAPSSPGNGFRFPIMMVWNDMFDKYHNAATTGGYYLVRGANGPWQNSWQGLAPDLIIFNWNAGSANSQKWFSGNSNVSGDKALQPVPCKQILSCEGTSPTSVDGPLTTAATITNPDGSYGVVGVCYTTWGGSYTIAQIANFATEVKKYCTLPPTLP